MIGYLQGKLLRKTAHSVLLLTNGVGYELECPASTLWNLPKAGELAELHVLTHVREDAIRLFGFGSLFDREVFETLIGVASVGPKLGLSLLGPHTGRELVDILFFNESAQLLSIPGVGKRKVEKLVVDLGPKIERLREQALSGEESAVPLVRASRDHTAENEVEEPALFDDSEARSSSQTKQRQERVREAQLCTDLESALLNMGHKEKTVQSHLDWIREEWKEGRVEAQLEASLRHLLQKQSSRLVTSPDAGSSREASDA